MVSRTIWACLLSLAQLGSADATSGADATFGGDQGSDYEGTPGVLHFALTKPTLSDRAALMRRDDYSPLSLSNHITMFSAQLAIGSNEQNVTVLVDTGSSDLWVMAKSNPYCSGTSSSSTGGKNRIEDIEKRASSSQINCYQNTQFDPSQSNSYSANTTAFQITYGDNSFANGTYAQDTVTFGGHTIQKANFAYATQSSSQISVWGIGLRGLEATVKTYDAKGNFSPTYSNLPVQMKEQGIIKQNAYSMWLNDLEASQGSLLFGGVDHARYNGTLQTVPMLSSYTNAKANEMQIKLDKITLYQGSNSLDVVQCAFPALLDSGTSFIMLPSPFLNAILQSIGGVYTTSGTCYASCKLTGGLRFDLSGIEISVPFSEILIPASSSGNICQLGMLPSSTKLTLGDTFLRSAYVVYDLDNYEVSLAQAVFSVSSSQVEAISSGVPSATKAAGYSSTSVNTADYTTSVATFVTGTGNVGTRVTTSALDSAGLQTASGSQTSGVVGGGTVFGSYVLTARSTSTSNGAGSGGNGVVTSLFSGLLGLLLYI